jgi:3,4-dihydroxy 2-butanone 4-phosphate synthase / GTP cyclohydrolase II
VTVPTLNEQKKNIVKLPLLIMKRPAQPRIVRRVARTRLPTKWGVFQTIGFQREICRGMRRVETAVALVLGELSASATLLRIHSQCLTGDVLKDAGC